MILQKPVRHDIWMRLVQGAMFCTFLYSNLVLAAEWTVKPAVSMSGSHDDNLQLTTGAHESVSGVSISPRIDARRATETSKTQINGYLSYTDYSSGNVDDKSEQALFFTSQTQSTERTTWGLDGEYRHDNFLESVNVGPTTGDLRDTDVGLVRAEVKRGYGAIRPSWNYLLTERSSVGLAYRFTNVDFSNATGTSLVDYDEHSLSGNYSRKMSPNDDFTITANAIRYEAATAARAESDTNQLLAGVSRQFSEATRGSFAVGVSETTEKTATGQDSNSGVVVSASMEQRSDLSKLDGVVSRDVTPSGLGRSVQSDQLRINWARKVAPTVDFTLRTHLLRNQVLEGSDPTVDRKYYEVEPALQWQWLPKLSIGAGYRYRYQKFDVDTVAAKSNAVILGVSYSFY